MSETGRVSAPGADTRSSRRGGRRKKNRYNRNGQTGAGKNASSSPKIFFCGDPHGEFEYLNETVEKYRPDAIVLLGDLQPPAPIDQLLARALKLTEVWWIPGNHDTDSEEFYDRLWHGPLADHNLHGRVADVAGVRIAGLGGVFRGQIWMPDGRPNYQSASGFLRRSPKANQWRGGLPRRHRSTIFPSTYEALAQLKADVLVTHEAAGCHKKGFDAIDRLARRLGVKRLFHGHQHEDCDYGNYKGMTVRAVGYRGIVDLNGRVVRPSEIDPRDLLVMQQAGEEPLPETLDSLHFELQEMFEKLRARDCVENPDAEADRVPLHRLRYSGYPGRRRRRPDESAPAADRGAGKSGDA